MPSAEYLKNKSGETFYPVVNVSSVIFSDGTTYKEHKTRVSNLVYDAAYKIDNYILPPFKNYRQSAYDSFKAFLMPQIFGLKLVYMVFGITMINFSLLLMENGVTLLIQKIHSSLLRFPSLRFTMGERLLMTSLMLLVMYIQLLTGMTQMM